MSKAITYNTNFNWHIFRKTKHLKMQENFIFFDTEANSEQIDKKTVNLTFKLGTCIIWNRKNDNVEKLHFDDISLFWNKIDSSFNANRKQYIMFAHNTHFDMKMVDGFNQLNHRGWKLINKYVRNKTYILLFKKNDYILHIWDTTNYSPFPLEEIGEVVGFPKLDINFDECSLEELKIYCMRDSEIIFQFIKNLVNFLIENDLSRLKATASSLSFSIFRHKFYNPDNFKLWIHDFKRAILLERQSYKGGITDVFRLGKSKKIYKTDINSQYPKTMRDLQLPTKLLLHTHESSKTLLGLSDKDVNIKDLNEKDYDKISKRLMEIYQKYKKDYGIIASCTIYIPKKYAYLLNDFGLGKTSFAWGKMKITLCTPELNFVEKYGKILKIHQINVYEVKNVFKEFVDFFYGLKVKYDREKNQVFRRFTKIILNGQYGKWGQKEYITEKLDLEHDYLIKHQDMILDILKDKQELLRKSSMVYLGSINSKELYVIDKELYLSYNTNNNAKESLVAISSFITSQARMNLVKFLLIANRENVYYADTDSLFINQKGYDNLIENDCIDDYELGKLKKEGFGNGQFYNPKFYDFYDIEKNVYERKCKGIKQEKCEILEENDDMVKYQVQQWDKFKSDFKKGNFNNQYIRMIEKVMSKKYDKGIITKNGLIEPFHITQINTFK